MSINAELFNQDTSEYGSTISEKVIPLWGTDASDIHIKHHEPTNTQIDPEWVQLSTTLIQGKYQQAAQNGQEFFPGPMFNVSGAVQHDQQLIISGSYQDGAYVDHWVSTHNDIGYQFLANNNLLSTHRFRGLSVCGLIATIDGQLIAGAVGGSNGTAVFNRQTENIFGGNFQPDDVYDPEAAIKMICEEVEEEIGYPAGHRGFQAHILPLVYAESLAFKANPSLIYLIELPVTANELETVFFPNRPHKNEFTQLLIFSQTGHYSPPSPNTYRSFGLDKALKAFYSKQ